MKKWNAFIDIKGCFQREYPFFKKGGGVIFQKYFCFFRQLGVCFTTPRCKLLWAYALNIRSVYNLKRQCIYDKF